MKNRALKKRGYHYFQIKVSGPQVSQNSQLDNSLEHFVYQARENNKANPRKIVGPETSLPRCVAPLRIYGIKLKKNVKAKKANNHTPRCRSTKSNKTGPKLSSHDLEVKLAKMCLTPYQSKEVAKKSKGIWALSTPYNKWSPQNASPALEDTFAKMRLSPLSPQSGHDGNSHATGSQDPFDPPARENL